MRGTRPWLVGLVVVAGCYDDLRSHCDGVLDVGEECDDGNPIDGDGCDCTARSIPAVPAPIESIPRTTTPFVIEEDGAWCWFQDERAIVVDDQLVVGSISHGGDVQVASYDVVDGSRDHAVLFRRFERDDHDAPSLLVGDDGRITAFYTKHDGFPQLYHRTTTAPGDIGSWQPQQILDDHFYLTYSNPFLLHDDQGAVRTYVFFRGNDLRPSFRTSDDGGATWSDAASILDAGGQRPYVKYVSDGEGTVHLFYTDGHPNEFKHNSVYHLYYQGGALHRSDASTAAAMAPGKGADLSPSVGTRIYDGTALPGGQAWTWDAALDGADPVVAFSTYPDPDRTFFDHRYRVARWDGDAWQVSTVGYAGTGIYYVEGYYSGGITIDPDDPDVVYFASNVEPVTGEPAATTTFELYRGVWSSADETWTITPVTSGSTADNLRPIAVAGHSTGTALVWMQGTYDTYLAYDTRIVGVTGAADARIVAPPPVGEPLGPAIASFDLASTVNGPATPTAGGFVAAVPEAGTALATDGAVSLVVGNITGSRDAGWEDDLYRDRVFNSRDGYGEDGKLTVTLTGLEPGREYVVRLHGHDPEDDYQYPTLWFLAGRGDLIVDGNAAFLGGHRNDNNVAYGAGATDLVITADDDGAIRLVARGLDNFGGDDTAVLNGVQVFERPVSASVAAFDVDGDRADDATAAGFTRIWFDDATEWRGTASAGGLDVTVWTDRLDSLRRRDAGDALTSDFVFGRDQVVVDVAGLEVGRTYEVTVHAGDPSGNLHAATRWRVEEPGRAPVIVRSFQLNASSDGPSSRFTFYVTATSASFRLRGTDVMTSLSTDPSLVVLNGIELRVLPGLGRE